MAKVSIYTSQANVSLHGGKFDAKKSFCCLNIDGTAKRSMAYTYEWKGFVQFVFSVVRPACVFGSVSRETSDQQSFVASS